MTKLLTLTLTAVLISGCSVIWTSPAFYTHNLTTYETPQPILSHDEYAAVFETHARPFVYQMNYRNSAVLVYGASHTKDPENHQIRNIDSAFHQFRPTVVLVEGRMGFLFRPVTDPVEKFGEQGKLLDLAKQNSVKAFTWEQSLEAEVSKVLKQYSYPQRVAMFYVLRPYWSNYRFGKPDNPDEYVRPTLEKRTSVKGLKNSISSIAQIDSIWGQDFPTEPNWRDKGDEYGHPGYLKVIADLANETRDIHLVQIIIDLLEKDERVMLTAGSSHAVKIERALQSYINKHN